MRRCIHELIEGTCSVCLKRDDIEVPDPFAGVTVREVDGAESR